MRALIVYESMFGNLRDLSLAVADGLIARGACVDLVEAGSAPAEFAERVDLLVVGAPTHAFGLPKQQTRADASRRTLSDPAPASPFGAEVVSHGDGVREWIDSLRLERGQPTATFDTKLDRPRLPGSAARAAARRLRDKGATIIGSRTFHVTAMPGPLLDGELVRARAWGAGLVVEAAMHRVS